MKISDFQKGEVRRTILRIADCFSLCECDFGSVHEYPSREFEMRLAKFLTAVAAVSVATSAVAAPAARLSISQARVASLTGEANEAEGSTGIIIGVVAAAAVVGGIIIIADDDAS